MPQLILTIDGSRVQDFASFIKEFNRTYSQFDVLWDGNLDAFNDYLVWPHESYILLWKHSDVSRERLGYGEMVKWLKERVQHCHPSNVPHVQGRLEAAKQRKGQTLFDLLVEIIQGQGDYVQLQLE